MSFLVDSQADISVIRQSFLKNFIEIDTNDLIYIKGITDDHIKSVGSTQLELYMENSTLSHLVYVVPDIFNIPVSGILGKDFLKQFSCAIDYSTMSLTIQTESGPEILNIYEGLDEDSLVIPPRSECIRHFKVSPEVNMNEDQVLNPTELQPGVILARSVFNPKSPYIRVINTSKEIKIISKVLPKTENLSKFYVLSLSNVSLNDKERSEQLSKIVGENVPKYVHKELTDLCKKYADIFAMEKDKYTVNNFYQQSLRIKDNNPVYVKPYRLPHSHKEEINKQVKTLLENDLIEPSNSDFNSPLLLVPKPELNGKKRWRMCVDYRKVNKKLVADRYPLPRIDEILDGLGRAKYFSKIDLFNGFYQIALDESSRDITSFSTNDGSYRWKVLPFGLNVSPNSFSRMMNLAFAGASQIQFFLYMDDLIVVGNSIEHHLENLESVFKICRQRNLKLHPYKCQFFRSEVTYLGHKCTSEGIHPDPSKIHCVQNYPVPKDKDSTKRFVAFANYYRRFIKNFAEIAYPLNKLTRKKVDFIWTKECQEAFETLKNRLSNPPVLAYPNFDLPFTITTDASKIACGAVLSQKIDGVERPIAFASKPFSKGESNKITKEQELIAIHWAIKHFRPYIYDKFFTVNSDHKSLIYLFSLKDPSSKLTRIRLDLEEHDFEIVYLKGTSNVVADALSRIHIDELKSIRTFNAQVLALTRSQSKKQQMQSNSSDISLNKNENNIPKPVIYDELNPLLNQNTHMWKTIIRKEGGIHIEILGKKKKKLQEIVLSPNGNAGKSLETILACVQKKTAVCNINVLKIFSTDLLFKYFTIDEFKNVATKILKNLEIIISYPPETITDMQKRKQLIETFHNDMTLGGHPGRQRLYRKLRQRYFWKNMSKQVAQYVKNCEHCLLNKVRPGNKEPLALTKTPLKPFDILVIDTIGPLPMSETGNQYALTAICDLTKYVIAGAMPNKEAKTVAKTLMTHFVLVYGIPKAILSDLGTEYKNQIIEELLKLLTVQHSFSTAYHHETVGSIERNHRSFNEYLRIYLPGAGPTWDEFLNYFIFTYNTTPNISLDLKYSPYELIFSKTPNLLDINKNNQLDPVYNIDNFAIEAKYRLQLAHIHAQDLLQKAKLRNKIQYDKNSNPLDLKINEKVILTNEGRKKHEKIYKGPYIVISIGDQNVTIKDLKNNKKIIVHKNRIRKI